MARGIQLSWRRLGSAALGAVLLIMAGALPLRAQTAAEDRGVLAGFISRLLSTPTSRVTIGAVEGALSSDSTIRDIAIADDQGVFLRIDRIRLVWRRAALLQRRIEVQRLEIGRVALLRPPTAASGEPEPGPLLPEVPLALRVDAFALEELTLGEPVLGASARLSAQGSASLGAPAEGLRAALSIRRLDAPGAAELSLSFVPQGTRLEVKLAADEPAGGVLARLARIPGEPPVKIDLSGTGTLDDFNARLTFEGGPEVDARGEARITRTNGSRLLTLDLAARLAPLLPAVAQPIFAGVTRLTGAVSFADAGVVLLRDLRLAAPLAELVVAGSIAADRRLDLTATARALPNRDGSAVVGEGRVARLSFDGFARGPIEAPRVEGKLDLAGLATPDLSLAALTARFAIAPEPGATLRAAFEATAQAKGFAPADPAIDAAIGRDLDLVLRGAVDEAGVARFAEARIATPNLALRYDGRLARTQIDGRLEARLLRLDAFSQLFGRSLRGHASLDATLSGDPSRRDIAAVLDGRTSGLSFADARLDRVLGPEVRLDGGLRYAGGRLALNGLRLAGASANARLDGALGPETIALDAAADISDLRAVDERLAGRATAGLKLSGATADPTVAVTLSAPDARALGRPVQALELSLAATRSLSAPDVRMSASGRIGGKPLQLEAQAQVVEEPGGRGWSIERARASLGSVALDAQGRLFADGYADGRASLKAGELDDLSPVVLTPLAGRIDAEISVAAAGEGTARRQDVAIRADGARLAAAGLRAASLAIDLKADDAYARPVLRGTARAAGLAAGGLTFDTLALAATDGGQGSSAVTLDGRASGFALNAAARVQPGPPIQVRLETFRALRAGRTVALAAPATLDLVEGGLRTSGLTLNVAGGRVSLAGLAGRSLDLTVEARAVPLSAADIIAPGLGLAGTAEGRIALTGPAAAPGGRFDIALRAISQPAARAAGLPPLDVTAQGTLSSGAAALTARIAGGRAIDLNVTGSVGLAADARLDLKAQGTLDAALANSRLGGGQRAAGRIAIDATVAGTAQEPRVGGSATISGGSFSDVLNGVAIEGIEGRITGRGDAVTVERLSASTRGGGTLSLAGRVVVDPARSFPGELRLTARNARLLDSGLARLVADADIAITGPLAASPRLSGRIGVESLDVRVPERFGAASAPLADARHVAPPPQTRARLAQTAKAQASARSGGARRGAAAPFRAALDLQIDAPARIFVRGRGIDAELGGSLRIAGTTLDPTALGAFDLRRGRLTILTQRLDFSRGRLSFGGAGFVPELDFVAETRAGDVTARVAVTGPADQPSFAFSSSPSLPEDEVLARLLFQRAAGGLSPLQALQLAQAVSQLSGGGGPDAFEGARRALGVDNLDVNVTGGGPTVGISRAIGDRARLNLRAGARPENTGVGVDIDLTRRLRLQSEIGPDGRASVGVGAEYEY